MAETTTTEMIKNVIQTILSDYNSTVVRLLSLSLKLLEY
jgi:hypothetical protein